MREVVIQRQLDRLLQTDLRRPTELLLRRRDRRDALLDVLIIFPEVFPPVFPLEFRLVFL